MHKRHSARLKGHRPIEGRSGFEHSCMPQSKLKVSSAYILTNSRSRHEVLRASCARRRAHCRSKRDRTSAIRDANTVPLTTRQLSAHRASMSRCSCRIPRAGRMLRSSKTCLRTAHGCLSTHVWRSVSAPRWSSSVGQTRERTTGSLQGAFNTTASTCCGLHCMVVTLLVSLKLRVPLKTVANETMAATASKP